MTELYEITEIDYWEQDAFLKIGNKQWYFQFYRTGQEPDIETAIHYTAYDAYQLESVRKRHLQDILSALESAQSIKRSS